MPAASFFSSASSFFSCSSRDALADCDALLVGLHVARDAADLRRHLHFKVLQLRLRLLVLEPHARQVGVRDARAERIADRDADGPVRIGVLEDVAEHRAESALRRRPVRVAVAGDDAPADRSTGLNCVPPDAVVM